MKWKNYIFHFAMQVFCLVLSAWYNNQMGFFSEIQMEMIILLVLFNYNILVVAWFLFRTGICLFISLRAISDINIVFLFVLTKTTIKSVENKDNSLQCCGSILSPILVKFFFKKMFLNSKTTNSCRLCSVYH